jgi:hypothetical protein
VFVGGLEEGLLLVGGEDALPLAGVGLLDGTAGVFLQKPHLNSPVVQPLHYLNGVPAGLVHLDLVRQHARGRAVAADGLAGQVNLSAAELPHGQSEVELTRLTLVPSVRVRPPRLKESPAHLECVLRQVVRVGGGPRAANLVTGVVMAIHVADGVPDGQGRVDPRKLRAVGRLGGDFYCHTTDAFGMKRP